MYQTKTLITVASKDDLTLFKIDNPDICVDLRICQLAGSALICLRRRVCDMREAHMLQHFLFQLFFRVDFHQVSYGRRAFRLNP